MKTQCFEGDHQKQRPALFLRSWPGSHPRQVATCCPNREHPFLLRHMATYSSQQKLPSLSFQSSCRFKEELNLNHHSNCWSGNSLATIFLFSLPSDWRSPSSHLRIIPDFSLYIVWTQGGKKEGCISLIHKLLPPATTAAGKKWTLVRDDLLCFILHPNTGDGLQTIHSNQVPRLDETHCL